MNPRFVAESCHDAKQSTIGSSRVSALPGPVIQVAAPLTLAVSGVGAQRHVPVWIGRCDGPNQPLLRDSRDQAPILREHPTG